MSVRAALRLDSLLDAADDTWLEWTSPEPLLGQFTCTADLTGWRTGADWQEDRQVLLALGRLTLAEESRTETTAVLVSLLLPPCEAVVALRSRSTRDVRHLEEVAAGYLWAEVAEYPWDDPLKGWIPQGVARRVGRAIDREFGWGEAAERIWRERAVMAPETMELIAEPESARQRLQTSHLYWWAVTEAGLRRDDMDLLVSLAVIASQDRSVPRASAGVTARSGCVQLVQPGQSVDQVQYRAMKALRVLRTAARTAA